MIPANEIHEQTGQIQVSVKVLDAAQLVSASIAAPTIPAITASAPVVPAAEPPFEPEGLTLSGSQVLVASLAGLCAIGLFLWAFLKLWVYE